MTATNNLGAVSTAGGGSGGTGPTSGSLSGTNGFAPGGGGAGSRNSSGIVTAGASGGSGQIILTVQALAKAGSTISVTGSTSFTYNGNAQGPDTSTVTGSGGTVIYSYEGVSGTSYTASGTRPTAVGSYRVTATVPEDTNYNTATSSAYAFTIVASGTTFDSWSRNAAVTSELVYKYAFGAVNTTSAPKGMTSSITPTTLSLTAVVRTDDPTHLEIKPETGTNLMGTWSSTSPVIRESIAGDQSGLSTGLVRNIYTVDRGSDGTRFIRLNVVYTP